MGEQRYARFNKNEFELLTTLQLSLATFTISKVTSLISALLYLKRKCTYFVSFSIDTLSVQTHTVSSSQNLKLE